jgi:integrase/recombinase XerD
VFSSPWKDIFVVILQRKGVFSMKVQRIRFPEPGHTTWLVLDDQYQPIQPILSYLTFLDDLGRSPNTLRTHALHLKSFWEFLRSERLDWTEVNVAHLAAFIQWLRRPDLHATPIEPKPPRRTNATIDLMLTSVHGLYEYHQRLQATPDIPLYRFVMMPHRRYKPFLYGIAKTKPVRTRVVSVKREQRRPKTLTSEQVQKLINACMHTRDRFLLALLFSTGIRVGQALGLKHEDVSVEEGTISIVPRDGNPNGARAKTRTAYTIPADERLLQLYTDYLIKDLGALESDSLPDYVFVNLWGGELGRPMTYNAVRSLVKHLCKRAHVHFTPHMLRHTRATIWLKEDKLPPATVARLLGHNSVQTTQDIYLELTPKDLRRALNKEETHGTAQE